MLSSSLFGAFYDQISTSSITYPDSMDSRLIRISITELNQSICRANTTISQQKYVFPISILMWLLVYILKRIIYISTAHISPEIFYGIESKFQVFFIIFNATILKQVLIAISERYYVEITVTWERH